jgi:hypothetical protein
MCKKIYILISLIATLSLSVKGQTPADSVILPADTVIILPEIDVQLHLDSLEPETPSSVPQ